MRYETELASPNPRIFSLLLFPFAHALDTGVSYAIFSAEGKPYVKSAWKQAAGSVNYQHLAAAECKFRGKYSILIKAGR
ncbi:MAG: hypothetical protein IPL65_19255 [Lewinellaceae bacterium]|nr:hypothetical protein [Lewinellaceae bacterium]